MAEVLSKVGVKFARTKDPVTELAKAFGKYAVWVVLPESNEERMVITDSDSLITVFAVSKELGEHKLYPMYGVIMYKDKIYTVGDITNENEFNRILKEYRGYPIKLAIPKLLKCLNVKEVTRNDEFSISVVKMYIDIMSKEEYIKWSYGKDKVFACLKLFIFHWI